MNTKNIISYLKTLLFLIVFKEAVKQFTIIFKDTPALTTD